MLYNLSIIHMKTTRLLTLALLFLLSSNSSLMAQPSAEACAAIQKLLDEAEGKITMDGIMGEDKISSQTFTATEIRKNLVTVGKSKIEIERIYYNINWRGGFTHYIWPAGNGSSKYAKLRALVFKFKNEVTYKLGEDDGSPSTTSEIVLYFLAKDEAAMKALLDRYIR